MTTYTLQRSHELIELQKLVQEKKMRNNNCHTFLVFTNGQMFNLIFMTIIVVTSTHLMCHGYSIHSQAKGLMTNNINPMKSTTNLFGLSRTSRIQQRTTTPTIPFGLYSQPYYSTSTTTISPGATKKTTSNNVVVNDDDDEESEDNSNNDLYQQIGIERNQLALGVKPEEVLKYIGT